MDKEKVPDIYNAKTETFQSSPEQDDDQHPFAVKFDINRSSD